MKRLKRIIKTLMRPAMPMAHSAVRVLKGIPGVGKVEFGDLRQLRPISSDFGADRGLPIDRFYIQRFLETYAADIKGRVLEIGDDTYTWRYGGACVMQADILHVSSDNPKATIVADLSNAPQIPSDSFDTIICTQTLQSIFDVAASIHTLLRILKPGGVLLATVPGITSVVSGPQWGHNPLWSFTEASMRRLLGSVFDDKGITIQVTGNVLAATAFLQGLATAELTTTELETLDHRYPVIIAARGQKRIV